MTTRSLFPKTMTFMKNIRMVATIGVGIVLNFFAVSMFGAESSDWPQFLGPTRDGIYAGPAIAAKWPTEGPARLCTREAGEGFSGPVVSRDRVLLFHRMADQEWLESMEARTGKTIWKEGEATHYRDDFGFDEGPRATPSIAGDKVVTLGAEGMALCRDWATGKRLWRVDCKLDYKMRKGFFGLAPSPLIVGNNVILNIGGTDHAGIVALSLETGKKAWSCSDDEASYASPITATFNKHLRVLILTREALVSLDPTDGKVLFRFPWRPAMHASVSAATPLVVGDQVFLSASYGSGASMLRYSDSEPAVVWQKDDVLSNHYATSLVQGDFLFGFDGRQEQGAVLRCIRIRDGSVVWQQDGLGSGTLLGVGKELLILTEKGELIRTPADGSGFHPTARHQLLPFLARAHPALANGLFFARSKNKLFGFDLGGKTP